MDFWGDLLQLKSVPVCGSGAVLGWDPLLPTWTLLRLPEPGPNHRHLLQKRTGCPVTALAAPALRRVSVRILLRRGTEAPSPALLCVQTLLARAVSAERGQDRGTAPREPGQNQPELFELGRKVYRCIKKNPNKTNNYEFSENLHDPFQR